MAIRTLSAAAERDGVDIRTGHRVQRVVRDEGGRVVGVEATTADGATVRVGARKAVVFATGGFTHDPELRQNFLSVPVYGGCAAATNEGDFVHIAGAARRPAAQHELRLDVPGRRWRRRSPATRRMSGMFSVAGDSMICVDKRGRRVVNEKLAYNELAQTFFRWDPAAAEYPNLVLVADLGPAQPGPLGQRRVRPADRRRTGTDDAHVIRGDDAGPSWPRPSASGSTRYAGVTGGLRLADDFLPNLAGDRSPASTSWPRPARTPTSAAASGPSSSCSTATVKEEPGRANPTMWPMAGTGPYYAALVTGGTLDTKGGPKATPDGQVLDDQDRPIPGLYGVGNCVASASARAYWAGGATLGPILAFAYRAATRRRTPSGSPSPSPSASRHRRRGDPVMTDEDRKARRSCEYLKAFDNGRGDRGRGQHPRPVRRATPRSTSRSGGWPTGREQIGQMFGDVGGTLKADRATTTTSSTGCSRGGDMLVVEGTSHGEHQDGPWRAGEPEHGAGRWCDVFEIRDWKIQRCFIYLDPDYAGQDTERYPWLAASPGS